MMGFGDVKIEGGVVLVRVNRTRSATVRDDIEGRGGTPFQFVTIRPSFVVKAFKL